MEFWTAILGLLRRWRLMVPLVLGAAALGVATYLILPTHYVASRTLLLTSPSGGATVGTDPTRPIGQSNPLLNFDSSLRTSVGLIVVAIQNEEDQTGQGKSTAVKVVDGSTAPQLLGANGPFVYIEGNSTASPDDAKNLVNRAAQKVRDSLVTLEKRLGAPESTFITVLDVADQDPAAQSGTRISRGFMAFLVALLLGIAGAYWDLRARVFSRLFRRNRKNGQADAAESQVTSAEEPKVTSAEESKPKPKVVASGQTDSERTVIIRVPPPMGIGSGHPSPELPPGRLPHRGWQDVRTHHRPGFPPHRRLPHLPARSGPQPMSAPIPAPVDPLARAEFDVEATVAVEPVIPSQAQAPTNPGDRVNGAGDRPMSAAASGAAGPVVKPQPRPRPGAVPVQPRGSATSPQPAPRARPGVAPSASAAADTADEAGSGATSEAH